LPLDKLHVYYYKSQEELRAEIEENKTRLLKELKELEEGQDDEEEEQHELENPKPEELEKEEFGTEISEGNDFFIREGFKFKITSKLMHHSIELFQTKYEPFFSCVARFHLPCVRGYYNGSETVLLPSCVSAMMTMMNIDYKYFAGSKDPIEIINKYRNRGFGTFLNDKEKIKFVEYSDAVEKWKKLYNLKKKVKASVDSVLGAMDINVDFFKPRKVLPENYTEVTPVLENYKKLNYEPLKEFSVETNDETFKEYQRQFNLPDNLQSLFKQMYMSLDSLKKDGYVKPLDKWFVEYGFNMIYRTK
jgi:hypothetical protein